MPNDQAVLTTLAAGTVWWHVALIAVAGAVVGWLVGRLNIWLEHFENLEAEEAQERAEYEAKRAQHAETSHEGEADNAAMPPWIPEQYGRTWNEKWLSPVLTAVLFALFSLHQGVGRELAVHLFWVAVFVQILAFDLKHHLVLDVITLPALVAGLILAPFTPGLGFSLAAAGAAFGAVLFLVLYFLGTVVFKGGLGFGDVKLGVVIGVATGFSFSFGLTDTLHLGAFYSVLYGSFLGGAAVIIMLVTRMRRLKDTIAYAPFLSLGAILVLYQNL